MDSAIHDGAECMSAHAAAGLIKFFSPVGRAGLSTCPGRDLPGQLDGLLRTSLPGKTVTGQDPASLDRLDLFQRGQGPVVICGNDPPEAGRFRARGRYLAVVPLCYRRIMAVRKKRSISIPPELDAEIAAAAQEAGLSYSAWVAQTARKEFTIRAGLEAVSQYEAEYGSLTPDEIAEADEWAARITQPPGTRRTA